MISKDHIGSSTELALKGQVRTAHASTRGGTRCHTNARYLCALVGTAMFACRHGSAPSRA